MGGWLPKIAGLLLLLVGQSVSQRRDPLEYIRILESAERVKKLQVEKVISVLDVKPGEKVADLGAGSGLFTRPLARLVGSEGVVYAVDIDQEMLDHIDETAREENLDNIRTVLASEFDPQIPEKVDLVLICDTLHQIKGKEVYLRDLTRYILPSGRVAIIDYKDDWPRRFESVRYTPEQLDEWMRSAGFVRIQSFTFIEGNIFYIYEFSPGH